VGARGRSKRQPVSGSMGLREHAATAAWLAAGLVCVVMMQKHAVADVGGAVSRGLPERIMEHRRQLAGAGEYDQAMRTISEIFAESESDSANGLPGTVQLIVSTVLVLVLGSLAAGAGIGGGGLFVPIYMVLLGAGPKGAVPLSKATILGGAVGNFLSLGPARHPKAKRPLIDYESSTFMQSGELLGVVFGVLLNNLLPAVIIVLFLVLILSYNAVRTLRKGMSIRKKETKELAYAATTGSETEMAAANGGGKAEVNGTRQAPLNSEGSVMYGSMVDVNAATAKPAGKTAPAEAEAAEAEAAAAAASPELKALLDEDAKQYPLWAWGLLMPMTMYTLGYSLLKNVIKNSDECEAWGFWLWYVTPVPVLGTFMAGTAYILGRRHKRKLDAGFAYLPADMRWDRKTLLRFPRTALLAGVTAGLLGIGGGMVIGPLFLSIGMEPQVGTSSCAFMILWTAFTGVVIYGVDDHLGAELALWCVAFGFISGQVGQRLVNTVLKKTGRPSYVVFLLGAIICLACLAMATTLVVKMVTGDYDANDVIEQNETIATHLFYLGSGFGCAEKVHNATAH